VTCFYDETMRILSNSLYFNYLNPHHTLIIEVLHDAVSHHAHHSSS